MNILLTGYTGNLGGEIARQLAPHRVFALVRNSDSPSNGVDFVEGSLESLPAALAPHLDAIIHGAASTAFRAPLEELRRINVEGTARLLEFARGCPRLRRFLHLSTICVCGNRGGLIPETALPDRPGFVNGYEQTKWEAEQIVLASGLPVEIARLSIVAGSEHDGSTRRPGALHHTLFWLYRGLIPMLPGRATSTVDLISTEFVGQAVAALLAAEAEPGRIVHVSAGNSAPRLAEALDFLAELFARDHRGWARGAVAQPDIVDAETFALFEASVRQSGDLLFRRVCDDAQSFLPGLLTPRTMATSFTRALPLPDWRELASRVFAWLRANDWGRPSKLHAHA